jgi:ATP-dependent DNA helicase RecG
VQSLEDLKGVGKKLRTLFEEGGIHTPQDLLYYLPRKYEDRRRSLCFEELEDNLGKTIASEGVVERYIPRFGSGRKWLEAFVRVPSKMPSPTFIYFVWFHKFGQAIQKGYPVGTKVFFTGKIQKFQSRLQVTHPEMAKDSGDKLGFGSLIPIYPQIGALNSRKIREIIRSSIEVLLAEIADPLPSWIKEKLKLISVKEALREIHLPKHWVPNFELSAKENASKSNPYFRRLVFDEFFFFSLGLERIRKTFSQSSKNKIPFIKADQELAFPFPLTGDQKKVLEEIKADFSKTIAMHRLVQGDVGSGKTIVAFASMIYCVQSAYQAAMLAPTQLLAEQHYQNFKKFFPQFEDQVLLLSGALKEKEKKISREKTKSGEARFVFGTQAIISKVLDFQNLGLVVIDEQHRFGVEQRRELTQKSQSKIYPHMLVMTATPIPRSMALTLYGDLELSTIKEKPAGRKAIKTYLLRKKAHDKLTERLQSLLAEGRQVYCVYPLVEDSEFMEDVENVTSAFQEWKTSLAPYSVGLLHGKMKTLEKEKIMQAFRLGEIKVLVSTTVIEVGVDVPNASVMVIENAERFGLTQLHQLRGRVGRGSAESICALVVPENLTEEAESRLQIILNTEDGFKIAEEDLLLRGPGDFLGLRQSGASAFRTAHLVRDLVTLEEAKAVAKELFARDPEFKQPENQGLAKILDEMTNASIERIRSG